MTVQDELVKAMPQTASTRSRFMITDILSGGGGGGGVTVGHELGVRSPSPGPRDLSLHAASAAAALHHQQDSDTDSSGHPDNGSICSNGKSQENIFLSTLTKTFFHTQQYGVQLRNPSKILYTPHAYPFRFLSRKFCPIKSSFPVFVRVDPGRILSIYPCRGRPFSQRGIGPRICRSFVDFSKFQFSFNSNRSVRRMFIKLSGNRYLCTPGGTPL